MNLLSQSGDHFSSSGDGVYQEDQTESLSNRKRQSSAKLYPAAKPPSPGSVGDQAVRLIRKRSSIIHFSFCHLLFLGKNCKFQGFWWANFPLYEKMRRTKGQRWDKVGLSRMRDEVGSGLTIGRGSKCIKCERNDNMGDRPIHNLLIILKCLLGRYKIDN